MGLEPAWVKTVNVALAAIVLYGSSLVSFEDKGLEQVVVYGLIALAGTLTGGALIRRPGDVPVNEIH